MTKRTPCPYELKIVEKLRREEPDAPVSVIEAEARHRFEAEVLRLAIEGVSQVTLAKRFRYSIATISRIVKSTTLREEADVGSPLAAWRATDAAHAPAPEPEEAFAFRPDESANDAIDRMKRAMDDHVQILPEDAMFRATNGTLLTVPVGMTMIVRNPKPRVWHLIQDGNELSLVEPPVPSVPEPYVPTAADRALFASINDRGPLLNAAVRMLQLAAGIPATGDVDDETMSVVAALAAWQARPRPLLDDVERFMAERRRA